MGSKVFSEFQSDLKFRLGNRTDIDAYTPAWINTAYRDLATRNMFFGSRMPEAFYFPQVDTIADIPSVAHQAYVSAPSDTNIITTIHDGTSDKKLNAIPWREYIKRTGRTTTASEAAPKDWSRYGTYIYLNPTPDAVYALKAYYRKIPAAMTAAGETTILGADWDEPIVQLATIQSLMRFGEYEKAKVEKAEWLEVIGSKVGMYIREEGDRNIYRKPDPAYFDHSYKK